MLLLLQHLHDVIADRMGNFLKPMWGAGRDDDYVILGQMVSLAALYVRAYKLTGFGRLSADQSSAGYESRLAIDHVNHIRLFFMHFDLARLVAMTA